MGSADLKAFQLLLARGVTDSEIDHFLDGLDTKGDRISGQLQNRFSKNGLLREQLHFLSSLFRNGVHIERHLGSRTAFIFYSSLLDSFGTAAARSRLQRMNANCIYLHDDRYLNFALGVRQYGPSANHTDDALLRYFRDWKINRVVTIGSSAAAFMAIKQAIVLNAYASVTFSPFTTFAKRHHQQDGRGRGIVERVSKLAPEVLIDLVPLLAEREPPLKLVCFYTKELPNDAWQAERVKNLRGTFMIQLGLQTHGVMGPVIGKGMFDAFIQPLAKGVSVEDSMALCQARYNPSKAKGASAAPQERGKDQALENPKPVEEQAADGGEDRVGGLPSRRLR